MTKRIVFATVFLISTIGFIVATVIALRSPKLSSESQQKLQRLREHCAMTSAAFDADARDLSSGDTKRQSQAADRMIGTIVHHSWSDIELCAKTPPLFEGRDQCWLARDYKCLERMARAASEVTKPARGE